MTDARVHGVTVGVLGQQPPANLRVHATQTQVLGQEPPSDLQTHGETAAVLGVPPPSPVTGLTATTPYQEMVRLAWQIPVIGQGTSYEVRVNGGTPFDVGAVKTTDVPDLEPGTTYTFEVRTINSGGVSDWVSVTKTTLKILVPFPTSGEWVPPPGVIGVDLLLVGAGGSGGSGSASGNGGGGGAGGVRWLLDIPVTPGLVCPVVIGDGGIGPTINTSAAGLNGSPTSFTSASGTQSVLGGGGGGPGNSTDPGLAGASGGGGGGTTGSPGGAGTPGEGFNGGAGTGTATANTRAGGGGGGAGTVGTAATSGSVAGNGGIGRDMAEYVGIVWGEAGWFGGGGGGSKGGTGTTNGVGGRGGGGRGSVTSTTHATPGTPGTGGGGGGGYADQRKGQDGGSGFLIVAYLLPLPGEPTNPATLAGETAITLTWEPPTSGGTVIGYQVRIDGGEPLDVGLALTHEFTGLPSSTTYTLEVRSVGAEGTSGWVTVTDTTSAAPGEPRNVAVQPLGTAHRMTWQPPNLGGEVGSYEVRLNGGPADNVGLILEHEFDGLLAGQTYEHEVRAVGPGGVSAFVAVEETVPETNFIFVWDPSTDDHGILGYEVALNGVIIGETDASTLWYHVESVIPGATYSMTVRALDTDGLKSGWSVPLVVTLGAGPPLVPPSIPLNLRITDHEGGDL